MESWIPTSNVLIASILSAAFFGFFRGFYYFNNKNNFWRKLNVKGPEPRLLFGNLLTLLFGQRTKIEREWVKQYGKVYGIYQGTQPRLVIADPEIARQIFIKDFDAFPNHQLFDDTNLNKYQKAFLFFIKDEHWKKVRALLSPTFTSGKIRKMYRFMADCSDDLINCITEQLPAVGERAINLNTKELYSLYALNTISTCCYGLKLNRGGCADLKTLSSKNDFVRSAMLVFNFNLARFVGSLILPKFLLKKLNFSVNPDSRLEPLANIMKGFIANRRELTATTKKFDDYLQLLVDARMDNELDLDETDLEENHHAGLNKESLINNQKKLVDDLQQLNANSKGNGDQQIKQTNVLTDHEILASATLLLAVGLETTSSLLSHLTYALAFHTVVQERLYAEIMKIAIIDEQRKSYTFDYDALTSCLYLDSVISETLRCLPPLLVTDRKSTRDYKIEKYNIDLPEGTMLNIAIYALHNDPDLWDQPNRFNPDRFMPENKDKIIAGSYCPFGMGPRHCLGMRFSLTETKLAIAKTLTKFSFEPALNTLYPPESKMGFGLNNLKHPLVRMVLRE